MNPSQYVRRCLRNMLMVGAPLAVCCAWFFSTILWEPFHIMLIYALCIGWSIQTLLDVGRYGLTIRLRKHSPETFNAQHYWPGWGWMIPLVLASCLVGYFAGHALACLLIDSSRTPNIGINNKHAFMLSMVVIVTLLLGCVYFFHARVRMAVMESHSQAAMRTAAESQLKMLESQLEPHMLFNTLANLRVLIGMDPSRAQEMLDRMIGFLRATLEASRTGAHPLSAEFARIHDYLEMMQVRMGPRLQFQFDLPTDLAALPVPPLLLQPLVENAIKHGLEPKVQGGTIEVMARREGTLLVLSVRDTGVGPKSLAANGTNFGMQQVKERIGALYGSAASLLLIPVDDPEGGALATIHLPLS